jgi:hypothetical protein
MRLLTTLTMLTSLALATSTNVTSISGLAADKIVCETDCYMCYKGLFTNYLVTGRNCKDSDVFVSETLHRKLNYACALTKWNFREHGPGSWKGSPSHLDWDWFTTFRCQLDAGVNIAYGLKEWSGHLKSKIKCKEMC